MGNSIGEANGIGICDAGGVGICDAGRIVNSGYVLESSGEPIYEDTKLSVINNPLEAMKLFDLRRELILEKVRSKVTVSFRHHTETGYIKFIDDLSIYGDTLEAELNRRLGATVKFDEAHQIYSPIVIAINGAGGSGKDTFVKACDPNIDCYNSDSVELPKALGAALCKSSEVFDKDTAWAKCVSKDDDYRQLISDLKKAVIRFNNYPNRKAVHDIVDRIKSRQKGRMCTPYVHFVHVREQGEIENLKDMLREENIICYSLLIKGLVDPSIHTNTSDSLVETFEYDLTVHNDPGDILGLKVKAHVFSMLLHKACTDYGFTIRTK